MTELRTELRTELQTELKTELRCLYEGTVTEEEIDHLGHMNVRFYATKARAATDALLEEYGLGAEACAERGVGITVPDTFTRHLMLETPRVGTRVQSFNAVVELKAKTYYGHYWVYDLDRGVPICISSTVNLAFDLVARKAIEIPADVRAGLEADCHPDLR